MICASVCPGDRKSFPLSRRLVTAPLVVFNSTRRSPAERRRLGLEESSGTGVSRLDKAAFAAEGTLACIAASVRLTSAANALYFAELCRELGGGQSQRLCASTVPAYST